MIWYLSSSLAMALLGILVYSYYHHKGQFDDQEEAKYLLFRDDEDK